MFAGKFLPSGGNILFLGLERSEVRTNFGRFGAFLDMVLKSGCKLSFKTVDKE